MRHDEFIDQVQRRARLSSSAGGELAARAVLVTLAERVPGGLDENVAGRLPTPIAQRLSRTRPPDTAERFDLATFVTQVAERAHVDEPRAASLIRAVVEVTEKATGGWLSERLRDSLPDDVVTLLGAGGTERNP